MRDTSWLTVLVVVFGTRWFLASSTFQHAKRLGDALYFKGSLGIRLLFGLGIPTALYGTGVVLHSPFAKPDWWTAAILIALAISGMYFWPEEVVATRKDVSQSRLLGLGRTTIPWPDVDYANDDPANGNIEVVPKIGRKIVLTRLHVGHDDFMAIARKHCRIW
jgi:hypothetical protein